MADLKGPLTHLQGRKRPCSLWLLNSVSKIQHTVSPVLTHTLSPPHFILKAVLAGEGEEEAI